MRMVRYDELPDDFFSIEQFTEAAVVHQILDEVKAYGDTAVRKYTAQFDGVTLKDMRISKEEREAALHAMESRTLKAIEKAEEYIEKFARRQLAQIEHFEYEVTAGVFSGQQVIPIERIGIYVPAGKYPLISTVLMCGVPARVAGVEEMVICSPPSHKGSVHPLIIATADLIGIQEIYRVGGAQAIAAMAFGTGTMKPVSKIVGPGNRYVSQAKKEVYGTVGIDFIAGPTELLIIADETAEARIIAGDLLAQAEHDINACCILVTYSTTLAGLVERELQEQISSLKTAPVARQSLDSNGHIIIVNNMEEAMFVANRKAPEHLELQVKDPDRYIDQLKNYGSLFIGTSASETLGDYSSGLNHTLPTNGGARYTGGLSVFDFLKLQTTLRVNEKGLKTIGPIAQHFGEIEGMDGHAASIDLRMKALSDRDDADNQVASM